MTATTIIFRWCPINITIPFQNIRWVWSGNTTITNRRQPHGTAMKSRSTITKQIKQSNQLSLPHQDDCNTRMDITYRGTKHRTVTDSHYGSNNKQKVNNNRIKALDGTATRSEWRLSFDKWCDSLVVIKHYIWFRTIHNIDEAAHILAVFSLSAWFESIHSIFCSEGIDLGLHSAISN